ncbi:helix-turn-helix domain-containing protein [Burkholderia glumae]|uniref:helix-turn-helix domain-containing protein n=1 Tax=Burkholderia glumae TaxID=337 RepID=UPI0012D2F1BF|nr:helix-turn-helix domain-containing protein [Burkholderia glumae]MCM2493065.1 helix-turn-helix domain-containing protein [Burkholderia glumae]
MRPWTWRQAIIKSDLPSTTRHVLLTLACHINDAGEQAFPSIRLLAFETGLSRQAVMTHLQRAAAAGWVRTSKHGYGGQQWARNQYDPCIPDGFVPLSLQADDSPRMGQRQSQPDAEKAVNQVDRDFIPNVNDVDSLSEKAVNVVDYKTANAVNEVTEGGQPDAEKAVNQVDTNRPQELSIEKTTLSAHATTSESKKTRAPRKAVADGDVNFEEAWSIYPKRDGGNPKAAALKAWRARIAEGEEPERLIAAVRAYAASQRRIGNIGTRWIKQTSAFFGPDRYYADFADRLDDGIGRDADTASNRDIFDADGAPKVVL